MAARQYGRTCLQTMLLSLVWATTLLAQSANKPATTPQPPTLLSSPSGSSAATKAPQPRSKTAKEDPSRRVLVKDDELGTVVARIHAETRDTFLVLLPDGRLDEKPQKQATPTDRPFEQLDKKAMVDRLKARFTGFQVKTTNRFAYVYNTSETFYTGTSRILETMYQPLYDYFKRMKVPVHDPDTLLVVLMFRTDGEFQDYRKMPEGVVAYYSQIDNRVAMYEHSALSRVAPAIAVREAIATVAHEGVHQILANIGVQQRLSRWPIWVSEGLAEYFAPTDITSDVRWKGVGKINELRLVALNRVMISAVSARSNVSSNTSANKRDDAVDDLMTAIAGTDSLNSTGYACAWGLTHFLAEKRRTEFQNFLADISQMRPLDELSEEEKVRKFTQHFGKDLDALSKAFTAHVKGLNVGKK